MKHDFLGAIKTYGVREVLHLVICRRLYTYRPTSSSHVDQVTCGRTGKKWKIQLFANRKESNGFRITLKPSNHPDCQEGLYIYNISLVFQKLHNQHTWCKWQFK